MPRTKKTRQAPAPLPHWVRPQLTAIADDAPDGDQWLHEIKFDGYRLHARLDHGAVTLLTRTGLDWTHKYPAIAKAVTTLDARQAYLDGELCGIGPDGIPSFSRLQAASDAGSAAGLVLYLFDLLHLDGDDVAARPLLDRKTRLAALLAKASPPLLTSDHHLGTLRQWMIGAGLWVRRKDRLKRIHQPRARRDCLGELVQIDGSEHWWFEDRGPQSTLLVYIDDATSRLMHLKFVETESTFDYFQATRGGSREGTQTSVATRGDDPPVRASTHRGSSAKARSNRLIACA
jgi:hypothetical protein